MITKKNSFSEMNFFADDDYCTRWVEVSELKENMEITVPKSVEKINSKTYNSNSSPISIVVMSESLKDNSISFNSESKNITSNMDSFEFAGVMPQILEMLDGNLIAQANLTNLLLYSFEEGRVFPMEFSQNLFNFGNINIHNSSHHLLNSSVVIEFPEGSFFACSKSLMKDSLNGNSSTGCQSILSQKSWSSLDNLPLLMYRSNISFFRTSSLANSDQFTQEKCSISDFSFLSSCMVIPAIYISPLLTNSSNFFNCLTLRKSLSLKYADQLIPECLSNLFFNSSGIDTVKVGILLPPQNFVNTQENVQIFKDFAFTTENNKNSGIIFEKINNQKASTTKEPSIYSTPCLLATANLNFVCQFKCLFIRQ